MRSLRNVIAASGAAVLVVTGVAVPSSAQAQVVPGTDTTVTINGIDTAKVRDAIERLSSRAENRPDGQERSASSERTDRPERPASSERTDQPDRPASSERNDRPEGSSIEDINLEGSSDFTPGEIAGIVIGSLAGLVLLAVPWLLGMINITLPI